MKAITRVVINGMPDLLVRNAAEAGFAGDNVYNLTGSGQSRSQTVQPGASAVYIFRVQNDGNSVDAFTLTGTGASSGWSVAYAAVGGGDITAQVAGSGWSTGDLARGAYADVQLTVTPLLGTPALAVKSVALLAASQRAIGKDLARVITTQALKLRPDMQLRTPAETGYTGDNIYNFDGVGQTKTQSVLPNTTAVCLLKVENDGNSADTYLLKSPAATTGWTIRFFVQGSNLEVTDQVTGSGWSVSLNSGGSTGLYVKVTPGHFPAQQRRQSRASGGDVDAKYTDQRCGEIRHERQCETTARSAYSRGQRSGVSWR